MAVTRRELLKSAAALGAVGALSHTLPRVAHAQTTQKKELVVAQGGDISKLDPQMSTGQPEGRIYMALYEGLTEYDPKTMKAIPAIAPASRNARPMIRPLGYSSTTEVPSLL
jgi:ABC-type oligopeptide transport system substrate-binding subunit